MNETHYPYGLQPSFLTDADARRAAATFGTPLYVYCEDRLLAIAAHLRESPNAFGLTARFAMKACPLRAVLKLFHHAGLHIDASSGFEARRAISAGIPAAHIQLTAQELPADLEGLVSDGVLFNACSLHQLARFGELFPGGEVSIRVNPGLGSGAWNRTNTGGPGSSFGIWHEYLDRAKEIAARQKVRITRLHSHIGAGTDSTVWSRCAELTLQIAARLPEVRTVNLGGGFKVARIPSERSIDLHGVLGAIQALFERFAVEHGRPLHLEVEPGTLLVTNAGAILSEIIDLCDTGAEGFEFLKLNSGMTEIVRPAMYGAQHTLRTIPRTERPAGEVRQYLVAGHSCESGDMLTPAPGDPEGLMPRGFERCEIGDLLVIENAGSYCAGFSIEHYNSFPLAAAVMLRASGKFELIREREILDDITARER